MKVKIDFNEQYDAKGYEELPVLIKPKIINTIGGGSEPSSGITVKILDDSNMMVVRTTSTITIESIEVK